MILLINRVQNTAACMAHYSKVIYCNKLSLKLTYFELLTCPCRLIKNRKCPCVKFCLVPAIMAAKPLKVNQLKIISCKTGPA